MSWRRRSRTRWNLSPPLSRRQRSPDAHRSLVRVYDVIQLSPNGQRTRIGPCLWRHTTSTLRFSAENESDVIVLLLDVIVLHYVTIRWRHHTHTVRHTSLQTLISRDPWRHSCKIHIIHDVFLQPIACQYLGIVSKISSVGNPKTLRLRFWPSSLLEQRRTILFELLMLKGILNSTIVQNTGKTKSPTTLLPPITLKRSVFVFRTVKIFETLIFWSKIDVLIFYNVDIEGDWPIMTFALLCYTSFPVLTKPDGLFSKRTLRQMILPSRSYQSVNVVWASVKKVRRQFSSSKWHKPLTVVCRYSLLRFFPTAQFYHNIAAKPWSALHQPVPWSMLPQLASPQFYNILIPDNSL